MAVPGRGLQEKAEDEHNLPVHHPVKRFSGGLYTGPYFDPHSPTNITTQLGTHAYLPCKVKQIGNKSVSIFFIKSTITVLIFLGV